MVYPPPSIRRHYLNYDEHDGTSSFLQKDCFALVEEPLKPEPRGLVCVYETTDS